MLNDDKQTPLSVYQYQSALPVMNHWWSIFSLFGGAH
jgi:hypothetical protein